jgi:hypothetical protein
MKRNGKTAITIEERIAASELEVEKAKAEYLRRQTDFQKVFDRTKPKKKPGRPSIWRTQTGLKLLVCVDKIIEERGCKATTALNVALKRTEFKHLKRKGRALETRLQELRAFFYAEGGIVDGTTNPWSGLILAQRRIAYEEAIAAYQAALDRHIAALETALGTRRDGRQIGTL